MGVVELGDVWIELCATLKALRTTAGMSLRTVEVLSGVGRGTLSAVENAKARPSRTIVEWYDSTFGGDGLPLSMFAEARTAHTGPRPLLASAAPTAVLPTAACLAEDAVQTEIIEPAAGALVTPGESVAARWRVRNLGAAAWTGRTVRRIGVPSAPALIVSDAVAPVPTVGPGETVELEVPVRIPTDPGTLAAYWRITHQDGAPCAAPGSMLRLVVVASPLCDA